MALKAWELAQKIADDLPPYLTDDELTAERFYQKNKGKMSKKEAVLILERLVEAGQMEKQPRRRKGKSGSHAAVYVVTNERK